MDKNKLLFYHETSKKRANKIAAKKIAEEIAAKKISEEIAAKKISEEIAAKKISEEIAAKKIADEIGEKDFNKYKMINIYLTFELDDRFDLFRKSDIFKKYGINFVKDLEECEFIFYLCNMGYNYYNKDQEYFWTNQKEAFSFLKREEPNLIRFIEKGKKLILYWRSDGGDILSTLFSSDLYKKHSDKLIIFKDFNFDINNFDNEIKIINGRHHIYLIYKYFPEVMEIVKSNEKIKSIDKNNFNKLEKIKLFTFKFKTYGWLNQNYDKKNNISNKPIDVMFIKNYRKNSWDCFYRMKIKERLDNIVKYNVRTKECERNEYLDIISKSKICISGWGIGECVFDDWKGILNNTIVLKPDTSYLRDYYNIYDPKNEFIIYFKPDLSDLDEKIEEIINNYSYYLNKVQIGKKYLVNKYTEEKHIEDFCNLIKEKEIRESENRVICS
jgi:hypothetical protein